MFKKSILAGLVAMVSVISFGVHAEPKLTVFAAASLTNVISDIAKEYKKDHRVNIQTSFAASSVLAKQIEKGAPADIFIAADTQWMSYLQNKALINADSKVNLLGNRLILIVPKGKFFKVEMNRGFNFAAAFSGKLCTGELDSVPAGIYAKQSLINLSWWDAIKMRIVGTQDVRATLAFVGRGECDVGIVYETDAKVSSKVETVGIFSDDSHEPIVYPLALVKNANAQAKGFYDYLKSDKAKVIFNRYGFNRI